jgi:MFS family permease
LTAHARQVILGRLWITPQEISVTDTVRAQAGQCESTPSHFQWNARIFAIEATLFTIATSFISATTVIPGLIMQLSGSEVIVGLAGGLQSGAWLLPQLFAASATSRMRKKKPVMLRFAWPGRTIYWLAAIGLLLLGQNRPTLTLILVITSIVAFYSIDAFISIPWFDLMAKCIPPRSRGRIMGMPQVAGGLVGIGVGAFVRYALSNQNWPFPVNYAILFGIASTIFVAGTFCLSFIREPEANGTPKEEMPSLTRIPAMLPRIMVEDKPFLRVVVMRVISGFVSVASAFYVLHATENLKLGQEATGLFISAQVCGSLVSGLLTSVLQDRYGPLVHIRVVNVIAALPSIIALAAQPFAAALGPATLYVYLAVFFMLGLFAGSGGWPFFNWILEYTDEFKRPLYIGIVNTFGALNMVAPVLGGWIARNISYPATFALALGFALITLALTKSVPCTRQVPAPTTEAA